MTSSTFEDILHAPDGTVALLTLPDAPWGLPHTAALRTTVRGEPTVYVGATSTSFGGAMSLLDDEDLARAERFTFLPADGSPAPAVTAVAEAKAATEALPTGSVVVAEQRNLAGGAMFNAWVRIGDVWQLLLEPFGCSYIERIIWDADWADTDPAEDLAELWLRASVTVLPGRFDLPILTDMKAAA